MARLSQTKSTKTDQKSGLQPGTICNGRTDNSLHRIPQLFIRMNHLVNSLDINWWFSLHILRQLHRCQAVDHSGPWDVIELVALSPHTYWKVIEKSWTNHWWTKETDTIWLTSIHKTSWWISGKLWSPVGQNTVKSKIWALAIRASRKLVIDWQEPTQAPSSRYQSWVSNPRISPISSKNSKITQAKNKRTKGVSLLNTSLGKETMRIKLQLSGRVICPLSPGKQLWKFFQRALQKDESMTIVECISHIHFQTTNNFPVTMVMHKTT